MHVSLIVLAGGVSNRFGTDKALLDVGGVALISRVIGRASLVAEETIVVVNSHQRAADVGAASGTGSHVVVDSFTGSGPLVGVATGLQHARGELAVVLASDLPFVSPKVLEALLRLCSREVEAAVPRWPNGFIEPLHAVYRTEPSLRAAVRTLDEGGARMMSMIEKLTHVVWPSTLDLGRFDPLLLTFLNVNRREDLEKIRLLL